MKSKRLMIPSLLFLALFSILIASYGVKGYEENETVEVWLTLSLREYGTDIPVSNAVSYTHLTLPTTPYV